MSDLTPESITVPARLIRATLPFFHRAQQPTYQYLRAEDRAWVTFEDATRFPAGDTEGDSTIFPPAPHVDAVVEWVNDLPRDMDGWPFDPNDGAYTWRLTKCCAAASSISDGPLYCKSCYEEQPLDADTPPRLDGTWKPGDGPITIVLPESD